MTIASPACGARLNLPRDLEIAYAVGRMGAVTVADVYALWYGSAHTCRAGFGRLSRLGLIRAFPRTDPRAPAWHSLTHPGLEWAAEQARCDIRELRAMESVRRANLPALSCRNRLWTSLVLASRRHPHVHIARFQPEWQLRSITPPDQRLVPDAMLTLLSSLGDGEQQRAWAVELDGATERLSVWRAKAAGYVAVRDAKRLYGAGPWQLLALVPSRRRAHTVAASITAGGAGAFSFIGITADLEGARAFDRALWPCLALADDPSAPPAASLVDGLESPISEADQRSRSAADRGVPHETARILP